jgi:hypothetical protein
VIVVISLGVTLVALFVWAISYDLYWRRRGFRTEVKGWGRGMTHERVPIKQDKDEQA